MVDWLYESILGITSPTNAAKIGPDRLREIKLRIHGIDPATGRKIPKAGQPCGCSETPSREGIQTGGGTLEEPMNVNDAQRLSIAKQIVARRTMARGVVVLDENLFGLETALRAANIKVVVPASGMKDEKIEDDLLFHRIVITRNPAEFVDDAPLFEYGIVALDQLALVDCSPEYRENKTAQMISKALSQYGLWVKGAKFLLVLRDDGNHELSELN